MSFTELARERGMMASSRVASEHTRAASPEEVSVFGIDLHELVFDLERLRLLDAVPTALDRIRVPLALASGIANLDFTTASVYAALEADRRGAHSGRCSRERDRGPRGHCAHALGVAVGAPLLVSTTMSYDRRGRLVEIGEIRYRADRYQFHAALTRRSPPQATPERAE